MADELYIKVNDSDDGTRPLPPGTVTWTSPSIWLSDATGKKLISAVVGKPNYINVAVDHRKEPKDNVKVQVWVCDYTLGGVGPASVLKSGSAGTSAGRTATATSTVAGKPPVAKVRWIPVDADLINTNDPTSGHVCAGVNAYSVGAEPEGGSLTGGFLDVVRNQHHGQHNLSVSTVSTFKYVPTFLTNPGSEPQEWILDATWLGPEVAMGQVEQETLLGADFVELVDTDAPERPPFELMTEPWERTRLAQGGTLVLAGVPDRIELRPAQDPLDVMIVTAGERSRQVRIEVPPWTTVPVTLRAELTGGYPGDVHAVDLTQLDRDGYPVGGSRVLLVTVPDWLR